MIFKHSLAPKSGDEKISKKFSWFPVTVADPLTYELSTIWLIEYYEKRVYKESLLYSGWLIYRQLTPFKTTPKLEIVK